MTTRNERRTLVQDLKYRFRIKAAQKHDLYDTAEGISALCRVTVEDVRNIWLYRLISETGLPSHRVTIPREIVLDMDRVVSEKIPRDKDGCIQFEHFLPTIVNLIRTKVSPEDEEEVANALVEFWSESINTETQDMDQLKVKAANMARRARVEIKDICS